jgi:hypothetical protein
VEGDDGYAVLLVENQGVLGRTLSTQPKMGNIAREPSGGRDPIRQRQSAGLLAFDFKLEDPPVA